MGLLDDNYLTAIEEQVEYMANIFAQAETAVHRVKDKYEAYKNDPRSKHKGYRSYRTYSIIIKYVKDGHDMVHVWMIKVSGCIAWWQEVERLKKFITSLTNPDCYSKKCKITKIYTK